MKATKIDPFGRAPIGSKGYRFYREREGVRLAPPLPAQDEITAKSKANLEQVPIPMFMAGGNYIVEQTTMDDGSESYVAVALVQGVEHAWIVMQDQVLQGHAAIEFMKDAKDLKGNAWNWNVCDPLSPLKAMRRQLLVSLGMYPELAKTAIITDVGEGLQVFAPVPEFEKLIELKMATADDGEN